MAGSRPNFPWLCFFWSKMNSSISGTVVPAHTMPVAVDGFIFDKEWHILFVEVLPVKLRPLVVVYVAVFLIFMLLIQFGSHVVTVMVEKAPLEDRHCIIIDPGHGGIDGGATSVSGVLESHINLQISLKLNDLLHLIGYGTKMIRTTDTSVYTEGHTIASQKVSDLKNRVKTVNETENALLVSIHQNTFSDGRYSGAQVFYADNKESKILAGSMQSAFIEYLNPGSNRKSKAANGIYLLQNIETTGILIECGFLTNPEEDSRLNHSEYQKKIACVIGSALSDFLKNTPLE